MPTIHVFDGDPVHCRATLKGEKFKSAKKIEFVFNEAGKEVARAPAALTAATGIAKGSWEKAKGPAKPGVVSKLNYHVEVDGTKLANLPEEIHVWARQFEVVAKHKDDKAFEGALARIKQTSEKNPQEHADVLRKTGKDGKIAWTLVYPGEVKVEWEPPYFLLDKKWVKNTGVEWESKIEKVAPVKLEWPPHGKTHKQWVNLDADDKHHELGPTVKVKVVAGKAGPVEAGKKIYLKAEYGKDNSERTPMAGAKKKGEKLEINMDPDALGGVVFDLPVGHAGGDTITVHVGSTDECKDGTVVLQTWRKLYYELMLPECMKPRLQQNEAKKWDLQETTRKWAKDRLAPVFIEYELKESHVFDNAKITNWLHDGAYLGKPAGSYYVLGDPAAYSNDPVPFGAAENRTIFVRGCDVIADANAAAAVELEVTKAETKSRGPEIYKVDPGTGNPSVSAVGWEAVIDPAANPTHPGVVAGKAKSGAFAIDAIELVTKTTFKVKLSGDAAALAGSLSKTKCPIKVSWKWRTADPYNGSASGGRQLMNLGRPVRPIACTIAHELGHSMGMTVLDKATDSTHVAKGQTSVFQCKPPEGLPYPDPVPDGDAYDGHDHTGDHCASGLTKAQKSGDHYGGLKGTCIMFGEGGDAKNPSRNAFCATCAKYLKARNLADLKTGWAARANSSLYEKGG